MAPDLPPEDVDFVVADRLMEDFIAFFETAEGRALGHGREERLSSTTYRALWDRLERLAAAAGATGWTDANSYLAIAGASLAGLLRKRPESTTEGHLRTFIVLFEWFQQESSERHGLSE